MKRSILLVSALLLTTSGFATTITHSTKTKHPTTTLAKPATKVTSPSNATASHSTHHHSAVTAHSKHHVPTHKHSHHNTAQVKSPLADNTISDSNESLDDTTPESTLAGTTTTSWASSMEQRLAKFAHQTVDNLRYSSYKYGGRRFDPQHGIYQVDCSRYVDNLLNQANPNAFYTLERWSGSEEPTSEHYYNFFNRLSNQSSEQWRKVENSQQLQAGDILVFRYLSSRGRSTGGHVMVVMNKSILRSDVVAVQVADSAEAGHSQDTRGPRKSGVGIGTLLLKVDSQTGEPYAYAWRMDAPWKQNVSIAMGRPADKVTT